MRVALVQAGTFRSDAGTIFGPVPRFMWERLVTDELTPDGSLIQALNCLLIETPAGRVLVETGIGERMDDQHRAMRGVEGRPSCPRFATRASTPAASMPSRSAISTSITQGGLLAADGSRAFPRARVVAQKAEWESALGTNPRLQASYDQARAAARSSPGRGARPRMARPRCCPGVSVIRTSGHSGGHQAIIVRGPSGTVGFIGDLFMRPWGANPRWISAFDDYPLTSVQVKADLFRQAAEEDVDRSSCPTSRAIRWVGSSPNATGSGSSRSSSLHVRTRIAGRYCDGRCGRTGRAAILPGMHPRDARHANCPIRASTRSSDTADRGHRS